MKIHDELSKCIQKRVKAIHFTLSLLTKKDVTSDFIVEFELIAKKKMHDHWLAAQDPEVIAAYWYLRGAAEALDLTLSELLEAYGE